MKKLITNYLTAGIIRSALQISSAGAQETSLRGKASLPARRRNSRRKKCVISIVLSILVSASFAFAHGNEQHVIGTVTAVSDNSITVETMDKHQVTVSVVPETKFMSGTTAVTLTNLKVGDRVVIHAVKKDDQLQAHMVRIGVPSLASSKHNSQTHGRSSPKRRSAHDMSGMEMGKQKPGAQPSEPAMPGMEMGKQKPGAQPSEPAMPGMEMGKQKPPSPEGEMQGMEGMQHMGHVELVKPDLPRLGRRQEAASSGLVRLEDLERMALEKNPTLAQANAELHSAKARQLQFGLYPNPKVGYAGDEIRGGSFGGGEQGFFVSQAVVTAGKLGLNRKIFGQDVRISEIEMKEQRLRVINGVDISYYRVLSAQEMLDARKDLARISAETVTTENQLRNVGQADESEVLQAEVDQQMQEMEVMTLENTLRQEWKALAAVVGNPGLEMGTVAGQLDKELPDLDEQHAIEVLLRDSPSVAIAEASVDRAQAVLTRARREPIPDLEVRAGLSRSGELLEPTRRPVGLIGFVEVGVQIPIFNHNQGNIQVARSEIERAEAEKRRVDLALRERGAKVVNMYRTSQIMVNQYRTQLLPRAQKAYELLVQKYGLMTASYPQVLKTKRTLYQLQAGYIAALEHLWVNAITLKGLLLTDGLEPPAKAGEADLHMREINIPVTPDETSMSKQP